ncbi:hypothetical protein ABZ437_14930 [Streptomyces microflavus]
MFTSPTGQPLNPNTDYHKWKELLRAAGVRDARHTAATVLLILGVPDAVVDSIMGWKPGKSARMRRRYQHLTSRVLKDTAAKVSVLLWGSDQTTGGAEPVVGQSPVPIELVVHVACLGERRVPCLHREHADEVVARWSEDRPDHAAEVEEWDQWRWEGQGPGGASAIRDGVPGPWSSMPELCSSPAVIAPLSGSPSSGRCRLGTSRPTATPGRASAWRTSRSPGTGQEVEVQVRGTDKVAVEAAFAEACAQAVDRAQNPGKYGDTNEW